MKITDKDDLHYVGMNFYSYFENYKNLFRDLINYPIN
jgi:hypothetical protein